MHKHARTSFFMLLFVTVMTSVVFGESVNMCTVNKKEFSEFISQEQINTRIQELGQEINTEYADKTPIFIGVLNGAFMFFADLVRAANVECEVDFIQVASYGNQTHSSGTVRMKKDVSRVITGRHVIVVEDIIDSGLSMDFIVKHISALNPASIKTATLLYKKECVKISVPVDFVGFEIASDFVVGYGLDYAQNGRHLGAIYRAM